jgi:pimeloyl-ACP methyl ester carboxylesterase
MVRDLHTLLVNANVPGPYILVGHSLGGYHVRLFASQYPGEVAGMVLVDSSHPDQWSEIAAVLPPESPDEPDSLKALRTVPPASLPEKMDILASAAQVRATESLGDLPLVVLSHSPTAHVFPNLSPEVAEKVEQVWQNLQNDLASLSSNSTHITATQAGHYIQVDEPQLVIDAILKIVAEANKRGP